MAQTPCTSIGISIYRQPDPWVRACIASARQQSDVSIEILIRPDGPEALSPALQSWLHHLALIDARVRLLPGAANLGTFGSYRAIFDQAQGQFLVQLDADDLLHRDAIARCRDELEQHPELAFLYTDCLEIDGNSQPLRKGWRQQIPYSSTKSLVQFIPFHLRLVRRVAYAQIGGYDASLLYSGDYDLTLRLAEVGAVGHLPQALYLYRIHDTNTSTLRRQATAEEALRVARAALQRRGLHPRFSLELSPTQQVLLKQQQA
ncbi:glycosyltransferase [Synechococcus sp. CBW1108]|uniref:glycosyltransferase n=1 Tax=Synechococcus sp. CBW1108 TaxID=1353147 RepID=UPI0018CE83E5|nr:glycosyltransferase [Synechococcus sp. CBW1108]QPN71480.1 glycosyltransferase [Synechococcus sp. CBW1108]